MAKENQGRLENEPVTKLNGSEKVAVDTRRGAISVASQRLIEDEFEDPRSWRVEQVYNLNRVAATR